MMRYLLALSVLVSPIAAHTIIMHVPHGGVHDIAIGPVSGGGYELVIASNAPSHVMRSTDDGLTWDVLAGDGLSRHTAKRVEYHPNDGSPEYLLGTDGGIWAYDPVANTVLNSHDGIPLGNRNIRDLGAPVDGDGPCFATTKKGAIFMKPGGSSTWGKVFDYGSSTGAGTGPIAVVPHFDSLASPGPDQTVWASFRGVLHTSTDGGSTWAVHPSFNVPSSARTEWTILDIAFSEDYSTSGIALVARGREDPLKPKATEGEIWQTDDHGATFTRTLQIPVAIGAVHATPPDGGGTRYFYLSPFEYMGTEGAKQVGIVRSDDGGLTWEDFDNEQDFGDRTGVNQGTGLGISDRLQMAFAVTPDFATDSIVYHVRGEGIFQSRDLGVYWDPKRIRAESEIRGLAVGVDASGDTKVYAGHYGSTTVLHNITQATKDLLRFKSPMSFVRRVEVSPQFADDGTVIFGGSKNIVAWFDPDLPAANPFGAQGWFELPLSPAPGQTGQFDGIPRSMALSPHFDNRGLPNTDRAIYWDSFEDVPMRSRDGGATFERIDDVIGVSEIPNFFSMAVAPSYDDSTSGGRRDVYAGSNSGLYRLEDDTWRLIHDFGTTVSRIVVDPNYSRPANPRLFCVLLGDPNVVEVIDDPFSATVTGFGQPLNDFRFRGIELAPDFVTSQEMYVLTWAGGVWHFDLDAPSPSWTQVGGTWPMGYRTEDFRLSPDFLTDGKFYVGTDKGLLTGDTLGGSWTLEPADLFRDDRDSGYHPFDPGAPGNPDPTRAWAWDQASRGAVSSVTDEVTDRRIWTNNHDGAYLTTSGYARVIQVHTFAGPQLGEVLITAYEYGTTNVAGSIQVNLNQAGGVVSTVAELDLTTNQMVDIEIKAVLTAGQVFAFDGISLLQ